uniref:Uncharacterized protein n=1 Tax=Buteo japonicus TaxID=224669 RepID=A0A8C0APT0_9AVES
MSGNAVAVVTWGIKGIGFTIVRAQRRQFLGDAAVAKLWEWKLYLLPHQLDVNSVQGLWDFLRRSYRCASVLVNNAAVIFKGCSRPAVQQSFALESHIGMSLAFQSKIMKKEQEQ